MRLKRIQAEGSVLGAFGATAATLALLVMWSRDLRVEWLVAAVVAHAIASVLLLRGTRLGGRDAARRPLPALAFALALLLPGLAGAAYHQWQFERADTNWSRIVEERDARLGTQLADRMTDVVTRGRDAARRGALRAAGTGRPAAGAATGRLFDELSDIREELRIDAVAVYTEAGNLVAWSGQHRGPLPDSIWLREGSAYFEERPLFSYLYFREPVAEREEYAIAAVLVETGLIGEGGDSGIRDVVAARTRTGASFRRGGGPGVVWELVADGATVVSARLEPLRQQDWRQVRERSGRRIALASVFAAFFALAAAWRRSVGRRRRASLFPFVLLLPLLAAAPLGALIPADRLFSPLLFAMPMRPDVSLGTLLALLLPLAALAAAATHRALPAPRFLLRTAASALVVAVTYVAGLYILLSAATIALLDGGPAYWLGLQLTAVLSLATVTVLVLPRRGRDSGPPTDDGSRRRPLLLVLALAVSASLALYASTGAHPYDPMRLEIAAAWAVPFVLAALGLGSMSGRSGTLVRWLVAGWLAGTAVLPNLWVAHVDARLQAAEGELETLGARADPYLEFLLVNFGREAVSRFAAGEEGVQLLYRTWVASGLAQEPYPAHIVLWSPDRFPEVQLGSAPAPTPVEVNRLIEIVDGARGQSAPTIRQFTDMPNMSRLLTVPVADGSLITVRVPPRRTLDRTSAVTPFLGTGPAANTRLNLVEVSGPEPAQESIEWARTPGGWRSEAVVQYPDGWYHAHLAITLPGTGVLVARATLLLTLDLAILALLWVLGTAGRGATAVPRGAWAGWLGSFRARVTAALFIFFLVPTAVFGWVAYRALAGEVTRAAQLVARNSVAQAVREFQEGARDLRDLAAHAGADVLRYQGGELIDVSSQEALDLGVYDAWLPADVHQRLESGEDLDALVMNTLGSHEYVTAYRALRPSGTLGVPVSLSAGDAVLRQQEFAHLVLFATVVGALLSLALSLAVGRALAGPIDLLRRASAAVGSGSLRVRLPERRTDEFGQLFRSFNRMTRRLRRARARELRTARVLAWGEMARQVAHEIKNPLTPIKLSVQHLRRAHADRHPQFDEILESNIDQVLGEIDRLSEIARAFSRYGAPSLDTGPLTPVDVATVVRETLMLYRSGDRDVEYRDEVEPGLPRVRARPDELKEVLLNLVENSRAALDTGGRITVSAFARDDHVEIDVADNGRGIPQQLHERIFEPHFSTRSSGTGLGLAIVRRLVQSWDGEVSVASEPGRGTTMRVRLLADRQEEAGDAATARGS
jgi:signal transduction histidine kinase